MKTTEKIKILFVDDEQNIINGLKRMFHSLRNKWDIYFALSGDEALKLLETISADVIITDMRMPVMDGAELLNRVQYLYPQTIRIILSGHSDENMILRSAKSTHQFLPKPCTFDLLRDSIEGALSLRSMFDDKNLVKIVTGVSSLPSLPDLYYEIVHELNTEDPSLTKISDTITKDIAMTAKILQFVNSAFFGLPQNISDPKQAVNLLGLNTIKALILSIGIFSAFSDIHKYKFSIELLWEHSMYVGRFAKTLFISETNDQKKADELIIAGLLHDIGKLIFAQVKDYSRLTNNLLLDKEITLVDAEYEIFGTSHAEVGAYLLALWGIPPKIVQAVAYHHKPMNSGITGFGMLSALHISNAFYSEKIVPGQIFKSPYLDFKYLDSIKYAEKLIGWEKKFFQIDEKD